MNSNYTSFLICDLGATVDIYVEGLPVGQIKDNQFIPFDLNRKDDKNVVDVRLNSSQYENRFELKKRLLEIIDRVIPDERRLE